MTLYAPNGDPVSTAPPDEDIHPARRMGRIAGRENYGNHELFEAVTETSLGCALDWKAEEKDRERAAENLRGFCEGWTEAEGVTTPLQFLTRAQTLQVQALPRGVRRAWLSEHRRAVSRWNAAGGALSGRRPVLPAIPS